MEIGINTINAIIETGNTLNDYTTPIPPNTNCYRINDEGDYVTEENWNKAWANTPEWWPLAWLAIDNLTPINPNIDPIDDSPENIAHMSVEQLTTIMESGDYDLEYAYHTDSGDEGIDWDKEN